MTSCFANSPRRKRWTASSFTAAALARQGSLETTTALLAILGAITANTITKGVVAATAGGGGFARKLAPGLALMLVALYAGAWLTGK